MVESTIGAEKREARERERERESGQLRRRRAHSFIDQNSITATKARRERFVTGYSWWLGNGRLGGRVLVMDHIA